MNVLLISVCFGKWRREKFNSEKNIPIGVWVFFTSTDLLTGYFL